MYVISLNKSNKHPVLLQGSIVAVKPPIRAYDGDSLNASIKYELVGKYILSLLEIES